MNVFSGLFYYPGGSYSQPASAIVSYQRHCPNNVALVLLSLESVQDESCLDDTTVQIDDDSHLSDPDQVLEDFGREHDGKLGTRYMLVLNLLLETDSELVKGDHNGGTRKVTRAYLLNRLWSGAVVSFEHPLGQYPYDRSPDPPFRAVVGRPVSATDRDPGSIASSSSDSELDPLSCSSTSNPATNQRDVKAPAMPRLFGVTDDVLSDSVFSNSTSPSESSLDATPGSLMDADLSSHPVAVTELKLWPGTLPPDMERGAGVRVFGPVGENDSVVAAFRELVEVRVAALERRRRK